jgi:hypothetical protein
LVNKAEHVWAPSLEDVEHGYMKGLAGEKQKRVYWHAIERRGSSSLEPKIQMHSYPGRDEAEIRKPTARIAARG